MTRVSDALARAAGTPNVVQSANDEQAGPLLADVPVDLWPTEGGAATAQRESVVRRYENETADRAAHSRSLLDMDGLCEKLVVAPMPKRGSVEQYRRLAARLHLSQAQQGTRSVVVTSAVVGEGKTLTATNLALTLSESYKRRVLLIDADLRRPGVHELFNLPNITGLNDGIRSVDERKVPLIRVSEYLSVLTAGRPDPDPMSVLASERMRRVLADACRSFDWVILDTPPVAVLSDAHLLATLVDTVVLVVRAATTQLRAMQQAVEAVGRDRILGVVLNRADEPTQAGAYPSYRYEDAAEPPVTV